MMWLYSVLLLIGGFAIALATKRRKGQVAYVLVSGALWCATLLVSRWFVADTVLSLLYPAAISMGCVLADYPKDLFRK